MLINPKPDIADQSYVKDYEKLYQEVKQDPEAFWENIAHELLWFKPWNKLLDWHYPYARWFVGGQCNIVYNALDRQQKTPTKDKLAYIWVGQPSPAEATSGKSGPVRAFTYGELNLQVCKFANVLKSLGIKKGDRVSIYLPRIPEQFIAMLACAKIGAIHSVVFSGFSADALKNRIQDAQAKLVITTDRYPYKDKILESKKTVDEAIKDIESVEHVIVIKRIKEKQTMDDGRSKLDNEDRTWKIEKNQSSILDTQDQSSSLNPLSSNSPHYHWYHDLMAKADTICSTEIMEATDPLFLLYTSGCCHKDTLIQLASGEIKKISDLVEKGGSKVININTKTLEYQQEKITDRYKYPDEPELLKIKTALSYGLFTKNHPFFMLQDDGEIVEKEARALKVGNQIMAAIKITTDGQNQALPTSKIDFNPEKSTRYPSNIPKLPEYLSCDFAQLLGYYLGDGNLKKSCIEATDKDKDNLEFYKKLVEKIGLRSSIKTYDRQRLIIHSVYLASYFKQHFPELFSKSNQRDIPVIIQKSPSEVVAAFIRGLFDAEGSITLESPSIKIVSTSKILIQKLQLLLLRFGIITNFQEELRKTHFAKKNYQTQVYELRITDRQSHVLFQSKINFSSKNKKAKLQQLMAKIKNRPLRTNIHFLPINSLLRMLRNTIRLDKKELRKIFGDSYIYTKRRVSKQKLPEIINYIQKLYRQIAKIDFRNVKEIREIIDVLKITNKNLVDISGKSKHTVHLYIHANKPRVGQKSLSLFYSQILPYLKKIRSEKLEIISSILGKLEKLDRLTDIGFFEIKDISMEENDDDYVYDLTVNNNHNYIANGIVVHNSTGKPKGVLHSHGGYMVGTYITLKWVFNLNSNQTIDDGRSKVDNEDRNLKIEKNQSSTLNIQNPSSILHPPSSNYDDIWFCTADAGWITGHSYIVYSPLMNGATTFVYEGTPDYPHPGIWWELIQKYKISKFYTAPTAIRALMRLGDEIPNKYDLSSLQILGTVGEPINPEAWMWYYKTIGNERCPIMDTWWQTETGMFMLTPIPSTRLKPGSCFKPFFGVEADIVDDKGNSVPVNTQGYLVIKKPWPAMLLDVYNNQQKYRETYFEKIKIEKQTIDDGKSKMDNENGRLRIEKNQSSNLDPQNPPSTINHQPSKFSDFLYFTGDSAKKDEDGYFWIIGRNDDVIKVSGHRLGSAELESAFVSHPAVAETAVIGKPHEVKGESIKAFVILRVGNKPTDLLKDELKKHVRNMIGPIATPDEIEFVNQLPKTRSGKIMRRVLKAQELGQPLGDTSTLET